MTAKTFFFGTWISGSGHAVSWGHYAMVAVYAGLFYAGLFLSGVEWMLIWLLILWPCAILVFINRNRPWLLRSPDGKIFDRVER